MEAYVGEIRMWPIARVPQGWHLCDGSTLSINDFQVLFAVLGTTWGGDGQSSFGLPDLRGRLPIGQGAGPNLTPRVLAQTGGTEAVTLTTAELPAHSHALAAMSNGATTSTPGPTVTVAAVTAQDSMYSTSGTSDQFKTVVMADATISQSPGGQAHPNIMPQLAINFIICTIGIFPQRN